MKLRLALFTAGALGLAAVMAAGMRRLEPIGSYHGAYGEVLNAVAVGERNSTDVVSAVNFDYRGLDTLGEEYILFVSVVAVQEGHTLHTTGFYRLVRHPSYLGIVLMDLGFVGVFRSALGLVLMPMVFWMFKRRMDVEEAFMQEQFGSGYREYMSRTARPASRVAIAAISARAEPPKPKDDEPKEPN